MHFGTEKGPKMAPKSDPPKWCHTQGLGQKHCKNTVFSRINVKIIRENTYNSHTWETLTPLSVQMPIWSPKWPKTWVSRTPKHEKIRHFLMVISQKQEKIRIFSPHAQHLAHPGTIRNQNFWLRIFLWGCTGQIQEPSVTEITSYGFHFGAVQTNIPQDVGSTLPSYKTVPLYLRLSKKLFLVQCTTGPHNKLNTRPSKYLCISECQKSDPRPGGVRGAIE